MVRAGHKICPVQEKSQRRVLSAFKGFDMPLCPKCWYKRLELSTLVQEAKKQFLLSLS